MGTKYIRDPVHDVVEIECELTQALIDTQAFQRLRRIKQLGLASIVYPGADHSRFSHSLGAFFLARKLVNQISRTHPNLYSDMEKRAIPLAALCHDIGHGPFSHLFEKVTKDFVAHKKHADHEYWTALMLRHDPEIADLFAGDKDLLQLVWEIITKAYKHPYVVDVVSSELDVDRFDYLLRDGHFSGLKYGSLDLSWILRCIQPREVTLEDGRKVDVLAFDASKGLSVVESYILGRLYMYKHLYWYHTIRSAELMLRNLLGRVFNESKAGIERRLPKAFKKLSHSHELSLSEYQSLDDYVVWNLVTQLSEESGAVGDIAKRLSRRHIFKTIHYSSEIDGSRLKTLFEKTASIASENGFDPDLNVIYDEPGEVAMKSLTYLKKRNLGSKYQPLYYFDKSNQILELGNARNFVNDISFAEKRLYVPGEIHAQLQKMWSA